MRGFHKAPSQNMLWTTKFLVWNKSNKWNSFTNVNLYWWMCGTILYDYKRVIFWFDLLERFVDWDCDNVILFWTQDILQFGWGMDRRSLKQNYNEFLAMNLLEIHCSSRSSCFSCVLRLRRFVVEVLRGFRGLNP